MPAATIQQAMPIRLYQDQTQRLEQDMEAKGHTRWSEYFRDVIVKQYLERETMREHEQAMMIEALSDIVHQAALVERQRTDQALKQMRDTIQNTVEDTQRLTRQHVDKAIDGLTAQIAAGVGAVMSKALDDLSKALVSKLELPTTARQPAQPQR